MGSSRISARAGTFPPFADPVSAGLVAGGALRPLTPSFSPLASDALDVMHLTSEAGVVRYRSAVDVAADVIRHRIHSGRLEAGAAVRIKDLAAEMSLSTTPVREALQVLEREGLVRIVARSGVHVRSISTDEVLQVYAIKQALEPLMIRWVLLRSSDEELRVLAGVSRQLAALARDEKLDEYVGLVEERQRMMLAMARSDVLTTIFQTIDGRARLMRYRNLTQHGRMQRSSLEQEHLARAIDRRDVDLASELSAKYVKGATQSLLALMKKAGDGEPLGNPLSWQPKEGSPNARVRAPQGSSREKSVDTSPRGPRRGAGRLSISGSKT